MLYLLLLLVIVIALGVFAWSYGGTPNVSPAQTAVQVGAIITAVRLGVFWVGFALYTGHGDWRQVVGYVLLIVNSVVELALTAALTGSRTGSPLLTAGLIVLTSVALAWAWAWLRARSGFR